MNILAVCDGSDSSSTTTMHGVAKQSKHDIKICQWDPRPFYSDSFDLIYLHYGGILAPWEQGLKDFIDSHRGVKWIGGIRGVLNFKRWTDSWLPTKFCDFVHSLDAVSVANRKFFDLARILDPRLKVFLCRCGVDTRKFSFSDPPKNFCIGWAGNGYSGAKDFFNFLRLPFPRRTAAIGFGTSRSFDEMPSFYKDISVYVSTSVEEGCPLPPLEAASTGRPVLALDAGCLSEWIPPRYIVPNYRGSWRLLTPLIQKLRDDEDLYKFEVKRFREIALKWDFSVISKEYDQMFEAVAD